MSGPNPSGAVLRWSGDRALVADFSAQPLLLANRLARALHHRVASLDPLEVEALVLGAASLTVLLEPGRRLSTDLLDGLEAPIQPDPELGSEGRPHVLPLVYGSTSSHPADPDDPGPDLLELADLLGMTPAEVVQAHGSVVYSVGFVGFSPGFAYLLGLPPALHCARKSTPSLKLAPGSVAIAGPFCGIYPSATPGGWHVIGRCSVPLFDPARALPALLQPGDRVRFVRLTTLCR